MTLTDLERVVLNSIPESEDHDYKAAPTGGEELAKDVAAFANSGGGVIFIGVDEGHLGSSEALVPVPTTDEEFLRVAQVLAGRVHPHPQFRCRALPGSDGHASQYMIIVEATPDTPHAVANTEASVMRYPIRSGTGTRYLREPEIAARYRARFNRADDQIRRLESVWSDGLTRIQPSEAVWLVGAAVPSLAGSFPINATAISRASAWQQAWVLSNQSMRQLSFTRATVGRRRLQLGEQSTSPHPWGQLLDLHGDGAAFASVVLSQGPDQHQLLPAPVAPILDCDVDIWTVTLLQLLSSFASMSGAGGDLEVRLQLLRVSPHASPAVESALTQEAVSESRSPVALVMVDAAVGSYWIPWGPRHTVMSPAAVTQTVSMTIASDARDLVSAASYIAGDLVAEFGEPEPVMLRTDGSLDLAQLRRDRDIVTGWAERRNVVAEDFTVPR
jgi:hypothetical protein